MTLANGLAPVFRSYVGLSDSEMSSGEKLSKEPFDFFVRSSFGRNLLENVAESEERTAWNFPDCVAKYSV
jgi:hypothetical protein